MTGCGAATLARPKGRPKKASGEGTAVRIDTDIVTMARYVAAQNGEAMSDYLSGILRPRVEKDFQRAAPRVAGDRGEQGKE